MNCFACSGPGAAIATADNIAAGYQHAAFAVGLLLLSLLIAAFFVRSRLWSSLLALLLLLHPAWTVSAREGDCGEAKHTLSWGFSILGSVIVGAQTILAVRRLSPDRDDKP